MACIRAAIALVFAATSCGLSPLGVSNLPLLAAKQQRVRLDLRSSEGAACDRVSARPWWKEEEAREGRKAEWNGCIGLMQAPGLSDCKSLHPAPASVPCNLCGNAMVRKASRFGYFYGCTSYHRRWKRCCFTREARVRSFRMYTRPVSVKLALVAEMEDASSFRLYLPSTEKLPQSLFPPLLRRLNVTFLHTDARADGEGGAVFALAQYRSVLARLAREGAAVSGIPRRTLQYFSALVKPAPDLRLAGAPDDTAPRSEPWREQEALERLPEDLRKTLCPYQVQGVKFAVERGGRCLIADEMGLGKTLQAIALAAHYQEWPVLIVTPASMRLTWVEECERWLPFLRPQDVHVIFMSTDKPSAVTPKVTVVSFQMLHRLRSDLMARSFGLLIIDESHTLRLSRGKHDMDAAHTQTALKFISKIDKVILLSGTPSPTKPLDMYNQISGLRPEVFGSDKIKFAADYCLKRRTAFLESGSCKRPHELHLLLTHSLMIRRLKKDVLTELPPKRRSLVPILINPDRLKLINRTLASQNVPANMSRRVGDESPCLNSTAAAENVTEQPDKVSPTLVASSFSLVTLVRGLVESLKSRRSPFSGQDVAESLPVLTSNGSSNLSQQSGLCTESGDEVDGEDEACEERGTSESGDREMRARTVYELVGRAKVEGAGEWLSAALEGFEGKMALFAHHRSVMGSLQRRLEKREIHYVRVDGSTDQQDRHERLKRFKQDPSVRVALVSVTAGGQGVDLSAATVGVFAELPPDVSWCRQAEDRLHRRGQQSKVNIYYLVAHALSLTKGQSSFVNYDRVRWQMLNEDLRDVTGVTDGPASATSLNLDGCQDIFQPGAKFLVRDKTPVLQSHGAGADDDDAHGGARGEKAIEQAVARNLFFEVSLYTSRIHLYRRGELASEVAGDATGSSEGASWEEYELLGSVARENFRGASTSLRSLPHALRQGQDPWGAVREIQEFFKEWEGLTLYQQRRLRGLPVQCPLDVALMKLPSPTRKSSKQRYMDVDIAAALPTGASLYVFNVTTSMGLAVNQHQQSHRTYMLKEQGVDLVGNRLCIWCQKTTFSSKPLLNTVADCMNQSLKLPSNVTVAMIRESLMESGAAACNGEAQRELERFVVPGEVEYHELFCSGGCMKEYAVRAGSGGIRRHLKSTDRGVCDQCGLDCRALCERLQSLPVEKREGAVLDLAPAFALHMKLLQRLVQAPKEGNAWHADHVAPVYDGGGECGLDNIRTLCVVCHAAVTRRQAGERAAKKRRDKGLFANSTSLRAVAGIKRVKSVVCGESVNATATRKRTKKGCTKFPSAANSTSPQGAAGIKRVKKVRRGESVNATAASKRAKKGGIEGLSAANSTSPRAAAGIKRFKRSAGDESLNGTVATKRIKKGGVEGPAASLTTRQRGTGETPRVTVNKTLGKSAKLVKNRKGCVVGLRASPSMLQWGKEASPRVIVNKTPVKSAKLVKAVRHRIVRDNSLGPPQARTRRVEKGKEKKALASRRISGRSGAASLAKVSTRRELRSRIERQSKAQSKKASRARTNLAANITGHGRHGTKKRGALNVSASHADRSRSARDVTAAKKVLKKQESRRAVVAPGVLSEARVGNASSKLPRTVGKSTNVTATRRTKVRLARAASPAAVAQKKESQHSRGGAKGTPQALGARKRLGKARGLARKGQTGGGKDGVRKASKAARL